MMSISTVSTGAAASGYYQQEGYYKEGSDEGKNATAWFGKAAEAIGLTGPVDDARFAELLDGQTPDGRLMGRYVEGERLHRPGIDLTFSASKSASIAALVIGDQRIVEAHDAAVRKAMEVVEGRFVRTRYQEEGEIVTTSGEGIIAGIYRHDTSRALDPNLHSHAVIANMVLNEKGEYTALRNEELFNNRKLITEIYRSGFEARMTELGIATERGKYGEVNISGIPKEVAEQFSTRRREIIAALDSKGVEYSAATAQKATLATRAAKHRDLDRESLRADWRKEAIGFGLSKDLIERGRLENQAPVPMQREARYDRAEEHGVIGEQSRLAEIVAWMKNLITSPQKDEVKEAETDVARAVSRAIDHVSERQSVYERNVLLTAALRFSEGSDIEEVDREIDRRLASGKLYANGKQGEHLTDRATVAVENSIIKTWRRAEKSTGLDLGLGGGKPGTPDLAAAPENELALTVGQRSALETSLSGAGRYVGVQGYAGTGKTHMIRKLNELAVSAGYTVRGYAPSLQATRELGSVIDRTSTLASVVISERTHPQTVDNSRTILLVDEASMASARDMRSFMDYAERTNAARVVLIGDIKQLDAVSAGQPFAQLQEAGMRTALMDDIRRQRDDDLRAAVYDAVRGDISDAFARLGNRIRKVENPRQAAAETFLGLSHEERLETRILTLTNASRAEINAAVRDGLKEEGSLSRDGYPVSALVPRSMTDVEKADARSYSSGDVLQSVVSHAEHGLQRNVLYVVDEADCKANSLRVRRETDGAHINLPLIMTFQGRALGTALVAYRPEIRELAVGEAVRVRITDKSSDLINGERARITSIGNGSIGLETRAGRQLQVDAQSLGARGLEHDYAATAHSVQGETVDRVIVAMNGGDRLATQKGFYVEISRAREEAILLTDNRAALERNIAENTGIRMTALHARVQGAFRRPEDDTVQAVSRAIEHVSEREAAYSRADLTMAAMSFSRGSGFDDLDREINRRIEDGHLFAGGKDEQTLTDKASVALELSILTTWREAGKTAGPELQAEPGRSGVSNLERKLNAVRTLSVGQKEAIITMLSGDGRYVGVQGYAGTGKTFMLESAKEALNRLSHYAGQSGYEVRGYAPSHQAVGELKKVLGQAETLAKVVTAERYHPQDVDNSRTILVLDEASMASAQDMRTFMDYAERTNAARVVLVGDTKQLDSVAAGRIFDQLQKAGMRTAVMDEVRRQRDDDLKQAVLHAMQGEIRAAFERLGDNVQQVEDPAFEAAQRYLSLTPSEQENTRILTLTNRARHIVSSVVRESLIMDETVAREELHLHGLTNRQLTLAQLADARSFQVGDVVMAVVTSRDFGLKKNSLYEVSEVDAEKNRLIVTRETDGEQIPLPLSVKFNQRDLGKALVAYEKEGRAISAGDLVRFRIPDPESGITNGMRAKVIATYEGAFRVKTRDDETITLSTDSLASRGVELDYAATAHAVQGESIDNVIVAMRHSEKLVTQKSFYVEISRARDGAVLLTDDPDKLSRNIERQTGVRQTALDAWIDGRHAGNGLSRPEEEKTREDAKPQAREQAREQVRTEPDRDGKAHQLDLFGGPERAKEISDKVKAIETYAEQQLVRGKELTR
ncbi:MobF family relaxase [Pukyongiella litopenaei]|uniref:AAA family ATPase n=1 Tax=Pukyongiella litopenaei TaxID=2605946 RepID=A0A5C2H1T9_9RHOB|nr:MobF family relaxase [Pukyongiella litopenaei]QEP30417.1 AAA family ATPase [Pukyongiella litopenaei]